MCLDIENKKDIVCICCCYRYIDCRCTVKYILFFFLDVVFILCRMDIAGTCYVMLKSDFFYCPLKNRFTKYIEKRNVKLTLCVFNFLSEITQNFYRNIYIYTKNFPN